MNRNVPDSPDELLRKLHETLAGQEKQAGEDSEIGNGQAAPNSYVEQSSDEAIAAFDSYMAELLGEVVPMQQPSEPFSSDQAAESDEAVSEPTAAVDANEVDETAPEAESAYEADICLVQQEVVQDAPVEQEHRTEPSAHFEVLEQLSILQENTQAEHVELPSEQLEADDASVAEDDVIGEIKPDVIAELADEAEDDSMDDPLAYENEFSLSDAQPVLEQENEIENSAMVNSLEKDDQEAESEQEQELPPVELREGDVLLDEEDEIPPIEEEQPAGDKEQVLDWQTAEERESEPQTIPTPVASPLDAARERHDAADKTEDAPAPRPKQSPLDSMAARAMGNVETPSAASAFGHRQSKERTLSDDDVELLIDLGYAANLTQKVGSQRVEAVRYRRQDDEAARRRLRHVYGCAGEEYRSHDQDKQIKSIYQRQTKSAIVRLVLGIVLALLMLLTDLLPMVADRLPPAVAGVPMSSAFGLFGIALLVLSVFVSMPLLERGFKALMRFSPIPASMPVLLLIVTLLYDVITLFYGDCGILLNFPTGMSLVILAIAEIMTVQREKMTFDVVSAQSRKIVMRPLAPRKKKVVRGGHIVKIINDDAGERAWRVHPTDQIAGYFRRNREGTVRYRLLSSLLLVTVFSAFIVGLLTLVVTDALRDALTAFLLTVQIALPVSASVSFAYPMLLAARDLSPKGCAIIGQGAVDEYAGKKTLIFDDTEMFRSKSSTEITIKGSGDNKKYVRYAKRLFRTLGGTLYNVSTSDLSEETYEERVEILKIFECGVEARIDGKVNILMGNSAFMVQRGIRVPGESAELLVRRNVESSILYLAFDEKLKLGYEIDYRISGRFEHMAAELARTGTAIAIETCDPSIRDDLLTRSRKAGQPPIAVVKPARFERHTESLLCDSGVVATRSARDMADATAACDHLLENDAQLAVAL